jgi:hypothetical protein
MGKLIRLKGVSLTDSTAPRIKQFDEIESSGSLMLFDGAHSSGQFAGLPVVGQFVPNALKDIAKDMTGGLDNALDFLVASQTPDGSTFHAERTTKGGIHGIITQAGNQTGQLSYVLNAPTSVTSYVRANIGHSFYMSLWQTITRKALTSSAPQSPFHYTNASAATTNYAFHFQAGLANPISTVAHYIARFNNITAGDNEAGAPAAPFQRFGAVAIAGHLGNLPQENQPIQLGVGSFGAWNSLNYNLAASRIIYRAYIEDLSVSGRTFAEVKAIDEMLFNAAFAVGGKFHGDTFTDPATIP